MSWLQSLRRWNAERYRLIQLGHELERIYRSYDERFAKAKQEGAPKHEEALLYHLMHTDTQQLAEEYDEILTNRLLRTAAKYGVPIPRVTEDSPYWERALWSRRELLTVEGVAYLRREIATEKEIMQKPFLNWISLGVSVLGLMISVAAFVLSLKK